MNDLVGKKIGRLTVLSKHSVKNKNSHYECQCECGNKTIVSRCSLRSMSSKSCGCLSRELASARNSTHKKSGTKLHGVWNSMIMRCHNENSSSYRNYGLEGIQVCDEWRKSFYVFYEWAVDNGYSYGLQIDRVNTFGNYEPSNCRWVTMSENARNKKPFWTHDRFKNKGVSFCSKRKKWVAGIKYDGKIHRKRFDTKQEAIKYRELLVSDAIKKDTIKAIQYIKENT